MGYRRCLAQRAPLLVVACSSVDEIRRGAELCVGEHDPVHRRVTRCRSGRHRHGRDLRPGAGTLKRPALPSCCAAARRRHRRPPSGKPWLVMARVARAGQRRPQAVQCQRWPANRVCRLPHRIHARFIRSLAHCGSSLYPHPAAPTPGAHQHPSSSAPRVPAWSRYVDAAVAAPYDAVTLTKTCCLNAADICRTIPPAFASRDEPAPGACSARLARRRHAALVPRWRAVR